MSESHTENHVEDHVENHSGGKQFTGRHMLFLVLGFFATIIAANGTMAYFAINSWTGLVVKNSYVASQNFNKKLERIERQKQIGMTSSLNYDDGFLKITLRRKDGTPASGLKAKLKIGRVVHENADSTLVLKELGAGTYSAQSALAPGLWQLGLLAIGPQGISYRQDFRLLVKGPAGR